MRGSFAPAIDAPMVGMRYVVFGASGRVGTVVASRLLEAKQIVRVVGRRADKLAPFAARGAEVMAGWLEDGDFVGRALHGARAVFLILPPYFGGDVRAWQDRTADVLCDALRAAPVPRVVLLSSIGADLPEGNGPVAGLHHLERGLDRIVGLSALHLRAGYFFENLVGAIGGIRAFGKLALAFDPGMRLPAVASRDVGEVAARRLLALDWRGQAIQELYGRRPLRMPEVAAALGAAIGRPALGYLRLPYDEARRRLVGAGVPDEVAGLYMELTRGFDEGRVKPRRPATATPTSIQRWAEEIFAPVFAATAPSEVRAGAATHA